MEYDAKQAKREMAALRKFAAIQKAEGDKVCAQKVYIDIAGDLEAGLVLDELLFFTLPRENGNSGLRVWKEGYLWMAVRRGEWWERKRLTPRQADTAIEKLLKRNLIVKKVHKFNGAPTTHIRLNVPEFFKQYWAALKIPAEDQNGLSDLEEAPDTEREDEYHEMVTSAKSQNGDIYNNPHIQPSHTYGAGAAHSLPLEWQIAAGVENLEVSGQREREMADAANLIATGTGSKAGEVYALAMAFMVERDLVIPHSSAKGNRKAAVTMVEAGVGPEQVREAVRKLTSAGLTVTDLFSVMKTAIDLAHPSKSFSAPLEGV